MSETLNFREGIRGKNRDAFISALHEEAPLYRDKAGFWVASRFEDVRAVLLDHGRFSSGAMGGMLPLISDDPPRHSQLRGLLSKAFTPAMIEAMRPWVQSLAHDLVAEIEPGQEVEVVAALTTPLPVTVIARMMDIPMSDSDRFKEWSNALVGLQDNPMEGDRMAKVAELGAYFAGIIAGRRKALGDDLISALIRADEQGVALSDQEIVGFCILLLVAGNETTTNLLGSLLYRLAESSGSWERLRADPKAIEAAIEEALRIDAPAQFVMRQATQDVEIGDARIAKGSMVMVYLAAANRDPAKWTDAASFDVARERERHVAFGHGVHTCIGAPLSRLEAQCAMNALVAKFSGLALGEEKPQRLRSGILNGFATLPLVFS
jgi:cytochrome P450